jgi:hypothetical protein
MQRFYKGNTMEHQAITQWIETIHTARQAESVSALHISDAELLGLLEVESQGDPWAQRPRAPYRGALQIGPSMTSYMIERDATTREMVQQAWGEREGTPDARVFIGARELTIRFYLRTQLKLEGLHRGGRLGRWLVWKAGIGATVRFFQLQRSKGSVEAWRWLLSRKHLGASRSYVSRVSAATGRYQVMIDEMNTPHGICAPMVLRPRFDWFYDEVTSPSAAS